jgi:sulfur carrier protein ThiS
MSDNHSATLKYHDQEWQIHSGMTIRDAIEKAGLDPLSVLAIRQKKLINHQTIVEPQDEILLVNVISGG